jgi:hypothetical protein
MEIGTFPGHPDIAGNKKADRQASKAREGRGNSLTEKSVSSRLRATDERIKRNAWTQKRNAWTQKREKPRFQVKLSPRVLLWS